MWHAVTAINENLANAGSNYYFSQHDNGQGFNLPQGGDLLIWTQGDYGHVMVVTESAFDTTANTGYVEIIDQNAANMAVSKYGVERTDSGYSVLRKDGTPMAGWLRPVNKNANSAAATNPGHNFSASQTPTQSPSFFQQLWNSAKSYFKSLF